MNEPMGEYGDQGQMPDFEQMLRQVEDYEPVTEGRLSFLRTILRLAEEWGDLPHQSQAALALAEETSLRGDQIETERLAEMAADHARMCGSLHLEAEALAFLAEELIRQKEGIRAEELLRQAAECLKTAGETQRAWWLEARRAKVLADDLGRPNEALQLLQRLPEEDRLGRAGLLEARLLWCVNRIAEALIRLDAMISDIKVRAASEWTLGCHMMFRDLVAFMSEHDLLSRERELLEWRLSTMNLNEVQSFFSRGRYLLWLARSLKQAQRCEEAKERIQQAIPWLGESNDNDLFEGLLHAAELGIENSDSWDPWLLAFEKVSFHRLETQLAALGNLLHKHHNGGPAYAALTEARRRYRMSGNQLGEAKAWLMQAHLDMKREGGSTRTPHASISRALRLARAVTDPATEADCLLLRFKVHRLTGSQVGAHRAAILAHRLAEQLGDTKLLLESSLCLASSMIQTGERKTGVKALNAARLLVHEVEHELEKAYWVRRIRDIEEELRTDREAG
jgi:tetratricopeptide (TPR) repeat protein